MMTKTKFYRLELMVENFGHDWFMQLNQESNKSNMFFKENTLSTSVQSEISSLPAFQIDKYPLC